MRGKVVRTSDKKSCDRTVSRVDFEAFLAARASAVSVVANTVGPC